MMMPFGSFGRNFGDALPQSPSRQEDQQCFTWWIRPENENTHDHRHPCTVTGFSPGLTQWLDGSPAPHTGQSQPPSSDIESTSIPTTHVHDQEVPTDGSSPEPTRRMPPPPAPTQKPLARRKATIPQQVWNTHKARIEQLFMKEDKPLPEVMKIMSRDHNFNASEKMYKTQTTRWGMGKYLKKDELLWMHWKAERRRQDENKDTVFSLRGQTFSSAVIQKRLDRRKPHGPPTPPSDSATPLGFEYTTPQAIAQSPLLTRPPDLPANQEQPEQPEARLALQAQSPPGGNDDSLALLWNGHTIRELIHMRREAQTYEHHEDFNMAEKSYQDALSGLEVLSSKVDDDTIATAYLLAAFYARRGRIKDADRTLDRVTISHISTYGTIHPRTAKHLFHIVELYDKWARTDDRDAFAQRIFESLQARTRAVYRRLRDVSQSSDGGTPRAIDQHLEGIRDHAQVELDNAEALVSQLITVCDADLVRLGEQSIRCRIELLQMLSHREHAPPAEVDAALHSSHRVFKQLWRSQVPVTSSIIEHCAELAGLFVKFRSYDVADEMFTTIVAEACDFFEKPKEHRELLDLLVWIGILYQSEGRWQDARPRFEHALTVCYRDESKHGLLMELLEEALQEDHFDGSKLPLDVQVNSSHFHSSFV